MKMVCILALFASVILSGCTFNQVMSKKNLGKIEGNEKIVMGKIQILDKNAKPKDINVKPCFRDEIGSVFAQFAAKCTEMSRISNDGRKLHNLAESDMDYVFLKTRNSSVLLDSIIISEPGSANSRRIRDGKITFNCIPRITVNHWHNATYFGTLYIMDDGSVLVDDKSEKDVARKLNQRNGTGYTISYNMNPIEVRSGCRAEINIQK